MRIDSRIAEGFRDIVGVLDPCGVDDTRDLPKARGVEIGDRQIERLLIEQLCELLLVEVLIDLSLAKRHLGDRPHSGPGRDADTTKWRDHSPTRGLRQIKARGLCGEQIGNVSGDQRSGSGHAYVGGSLPASDACTRLLAESRVGFVADHDRVRIRDLSRITDEPLIGLDSHRTISPVVISHQRW